MLTSLGVKNYRNLKSLEIDKLARVNLIAGKNNTGKTSLLEVISLYADRGSLHRIDHLLKERGEFYSELNNSLENNLKSYVSLFHNPSREVNLSNSYKLRINVSKESNSLGSKHSLEDVLRVEIEFYEDSHLNLKVTFNESSYGPYDLANLDQTSRSLDRMKRSPLRSQFVRTFLYEDEGVAKIWDYVASKPEEQYLVDALKLIDKNVESISFIKDESKLDGRKAVVGRDRNRLPLKSMGDGMNRLLTIILGLVVASDDGRDSFLLIDEFENGLHYTVQEDLWRMIFKLAKELNVQVFATTHSNDCIRAFENVLNENNQSEGQFLRLDKFDDQIVPTLYSASELATATDHLIEVR